MITVSEYQFKEQIYECNSSIVYRGYDTANDKPVILKLMKQEYPSTEQLARVRHEFEMINRLQLEGVIQAYKQMFHKNRLLIVLEDFGGESLSKLLSSRQINLNEFLRLAIRITSVLGEIHQQHIIHKDINPSNIVWNPETDMLKVIDFDIASQLSHETASALNPNKLEGTLAYMSPEQTGRMNRSMDYRTDFYSLGATFYEMLTGKLPFESTDALELVYCHIAKTPVPPHLLNSPFEEGQGYVFEIPVALSEIVMKLMAKSVEDRYQSSFGIKHDLEYCLEQASQSGFVLAQNDFSDRFQIPQRLYGRENEINTLLKTFELAAEGSCEFMLVSGYSGIGKSALVNEIHKPVVQKKGYFISGKSGQFQKDIPYSAIVQAFRDLSKQLLSEPDEKLKTWKDNLLKAFGPNGQIIIDIIPEMEHIVGKQPPVQELNPTEAQNRFMIVFRDFVKVFAQAEHPLVIFLDDLQWSDQPSLNIIQNLITKEIPQLFIIGAYRDNEVSEGHPLLLALDEIRKTKEIHDLHLMPLAETTINMIIADTLHFKPEDTGSLSNIMFKKAEGNPFFTKELFMNLYKEGFLNFNYKQRRWEWEADRIKEIKIAGNVVEFMLDRLMKLSKDCRESLRLAACIGNHFDLETLSVIIEKSVVQTAKMLWEAMKEEIVIPLSNKYRLLTDESLSAVENPKSGSFGITYKFQHDRIQQAAYSLIEKDRKKEVHLSIGRLMLQNTSEDELHERLIDIVRHLNEGRELITDMREKEKLSRLNLQAGIKAKNSTAYQPALQYLETGIALLPENPWEKLYELSFSLSIEYAQCAYLTGKHEAAEKRIELMLNRAKTKLEKSEILSTRSRQYVTIGKPEESIQAGIKGLSLLGIKIPYHPGKLAILKEILLAKWNLGKRKIADLIDAPELTDPKKIITLKLLSEMGPSAYLTGNKTLFAMIPLKVVNISLRYGNSPESAFAYAAYGILLCSVLGDLKSGYKFGKLAISLNERFRNMELKSRVILVYSAFIHHLNKHWSTLTPWFQKGIEAGYQSGDLFYLSKNAQHCVVWNPKLDLETSCEEQKEISVHCQRYRISGLVGHGYSVSTNLFELSRFDK